ncbi:MAG: hypothetical protein ACFE96_02695, partial [Candidatus Hermodarchaeota archaeon]
MKNKIKTIISVNLLILSVLIACTNQFKVAHAQSNGDSLTIDVKYNLQEFSNFTKTQTNTDHVNISLSSTKWNVTNLEVDITDIKLGEEIKSIEENYSDFRYVYKSIKGYGVQLNITEDIELLGVEIYGYLEPELRIPPVFVQINGYDQFNNWPNETVYGSSVKINISTIPGWYVQMFPEPISLSKGSYYLVVNGSSYAPNNNSRYYWYLNDIDSIHTDLYTSKYISDTWSIEDQGKPFTHRLIQRTHKSYNPEDINMTLEVDGNFYNITHISPGSGKVEVSNVNLPLNQNDLIFPVHHNQSVGLMFNVSCNLELKNYLTTPGTLEVAVTHDNYWRVTPIINPEYFNYSVKFEFPEKWSDISVLRNSVNISSQVDINYIENII